MYVLFCTLLTLSQSAEHCVYMNVFVRIRVKKRKCWVSATWISHLLAFVLYSFHHHTSLQFSLSIFKHSNLHHSFLLTSGLWSVCCSGGCRVLQARGGAAVVFQSARHGLQRSAEQTWSSTTSSVPATEAKATTVHQEVCRVLRQGQRPRPYAGGTEGLPGSLRWVSQMCAYVCIPNDCSVIQSIIL